MDIVMSVAKLLSAGLTLVGGFITINSLWEMADARSQNRPSTGTEWWTLVKGALLVAVGVSGVIQTALSNLAF